MNANSKPLALPRTINDWLTDTTARLHEAGISSARLDAELILAHAIGKDRSWVIAHDGEVFDDAEKRHLANTLATKRLHRVPIAYLTGSREFYGRKFRVTSDVLIPRPETEVLVEKLLSLTLENNPTVHEVGTGSGCIAVTVALEMPGAHVSASDISPLALKVAEANALSLDADVDFYESDLLDFATSTGHMDVIVANLPYVDETWARSPETDHEPSLALFADEHGLALITKLIGQSESRLVPGGYLLLEADPVQHADIIKTGAAHGLRSVEADDYVVVLRRD